MSIVGIGLILLLSFLLCSNKKKISLRTTFSSFFLLLAIAVFIFKIPIGIKIIEGISNGANIILQQGQKGAAFLFGDLATKCGFIFIIVVLTNVIFLGSLFAILYYLRIMRPINFIFSFILVKLLKITKAESLNSVVNIFLGPGESQLVLKPFIPHLTKSELFTMMVSSFAAIAGSVMGGYIALGMPAQYVICAVLMTIPSSILISKLMVPETEEEVNEKNIKIEKLPEEKAKTFLEALTIGAYSGLKVAVAIGIMLICFISLIALLNEILTYIGNIFHIQSLTLQKILGYILSPVAYIMGVPAADIQIAGALIGEKTITNEFVAYLELKEYIKEGVLSPKSQMILIFSLCGFANLSTVGMFIGSMNSIDRAKSKVFSQLAGKALLAAILVNLLNGAIAGIMYDLQNLIQ